MTLNLAGMPKEKIEYRNFSGSRCQYLLYSEQDQPKSLEVLRLGNLHDTVISIYACMYHLVVQQKHTDAQIDRTRS